MSVIDVVGKIINTEERIQPPRWKKAGPDNGRRGGVRGALVTVIRWREQCNVPHRDIGKRMDPAPRCCSSRWCARRGVRCSPGCDWQFEQQHQELGFALSKVEIGGRGAGRADMANSAPIHDCGNKLMGRLHEGHEVRGLDTAARRHIYAQGDTRAGQLQGSAHVLGSLPHLMLDDADHRGDCSVKGQQDD